MSNNKIYRSPLFYVGDKYKLLSEIKIFFPEKINRFIEPFMGGGSVFLNVNAKEYLLNDIDENVIKIHLFLVQQSRNPNRFFKNIEKEILRYGLSRSYIEDIIPQKLKKQWKKTYYAKFNKIGFQKLKEDFNRSNKDNILYLYILLIYGFNRMLRFNSKGEFNVPVGNVDFNKNVYNALSNYFRIVKNKKISFFNLDFVDFIKQIKFQKNDFIYFDPPYLITFSEYNKYWNEQREQELINLLDELHKKNINFAISNVIHYKGKTNNHFLKWCKKYNSFDIKSNYINYHDNTIKSSKEVLVTNFKSNNKHLTTKEHIYGNI